MSSKYYSDPTDEHLSQDGGNESSQAVMEPECDTPANAAGATGPTCEKCGAAIKSDLVAICRSCGWYASLGRHVELDSNWDTPEVEDAGNGNVAPVAQPSHLGVWLNLLPWWAWFIMASIAAVIVESVVAVLVTPAEIGGLRTKWSLLQLFLGVVAFVVCHFANFLVYVAEDSDVGLLDVLLRPVKLWMRTAYHLPAKLWLVNTAVCGVTAATMSILVIGALPYDRLWDWGFKAPVKQNLMGAVMDRAKKIKGNESDNLEDAIGDFAGKAGVDGNDMPKATPAKPREKADCVILGYQLDRDERLEYLVLATSHNKKLVFAGRVKPEVSEQQRTALLQQLNRIRAMQPFIPVQTDSATWVQAKYACRVSYTERMKGGQLRDPQWETLLGTIPGQ